MKTPLCLIAATLMLLALLVACAPAAPTAAPTKPVSAPATAPVGATSAPPAAPSVASPASPAVAASPTAAPKPAATPAAKVKRGGNLRIATAWTHPTFDVHLSSTGRAPAYSLLFENLVQYRLVDYQTAKFELRPDLAESWNFPDEKTIVMTLRKGVKFHDGSDFNAEVARWNLERIRTHPKSQGRASFEAVDGIDVINDQAIRIRLKTPSAAQLVLLTRAGGGVGMLSKTAVETLGEDEFGKKPAGTGPMQLNNFMPDDFVNLRCFDGYWQKGADGQPLPYLDSSNMRVIQDPAVSLLEMRAGTIDLIDEIEGKDIAPVRANPETVYYEMHWVGPVHFTYGVNVGQGPFTNLKLRQAAQYALDRDNMAKALGFGVAKAHHIPYWGPGMLGYDEAANPTYKFDLNKAKQLVVEAGYPNGVDVELSAISRQPEQRIGEMVTAMWGAAGLRAKLDVLERLAWIDKMRSKKFVAGFFRGATEVDPDVISKALTSGGPGNWTDWRNADFDQCMAEGRSTYDNAKRHESYKRCIKILMEDAAIGSGFFIPSNVVHHKSVKGFLAQWRAWDLREIWLDR